ncbi:MAG: STAS domain-containing protein [Phycisphaerae bacterium]|jgi:anti-anti-sigma factor|nr:STAS domain-containing protein [Phycisphaerae bacterium]
MAIQNWSDEITIVELSDDPQFTEDLDGLMDSVESKATDVVLNLGAVGFINSSNVAKLLRVRKVMLAVDRRLVLCDVNAQVWGIFLVTGLDKIFEFTSDVAIALASLQMEMAADNEAAEAASEEDDSAE